MPVKPAAREMPLRTRGDQASEEDGQGTVSREPAVRPIDVLDIDERDPGIALDEAA